MDTETLCQEIENLKISIKRLHEEAWSHRMTRDTIALLCTKQLIRMQQARIKDCEWAKAQISIEDSMHHQRLGRRFSRGHSRSLSSKPLDDVKISTIQSTTPHTHTDIENCSGDKRPE